jgi:hypothetical protein
MTTDIEIARSAEKRPIAEIAAKLDIPADAIAPYGTDKAKIDISALGTATRAPGKLILVTAINPTPAGEGKTTTTVGLGDGLARIGKRAAVCIREASLGPCFGMKGGAAGGGRAQVIPMEDMNLHFTGDFHAITSAHNLLSAMIDNHIHWGNALGIDVRRVTWRRVMDMNDRALRDITVGLGGPGNGYPRQSGFDITVASEVMAVLCLHRISRRSPAPARRHDRGPPPRSKCDHLPRPEGRRGDDGPAQGCAEAQPRADARTDARVRPRRPLCQYRPRLQLGDGDEDRAFARGLCRDGSRFRGGSRRGKVLQHQVPQVGPRTRRRW